MASKTRNGSTQATAVVRVPEEGNNRMFCVGCGARNGPDANFCKQCGQKIDRTSAPKFTEEEFAALGRPEERMGDLLVRAFHKEESGDLEGALAICSEALKLEPESTSAHSLMGLLYEKKGDREKAVAEFEHVLKLNPGSIADREKLEQLRDSTTVITPRKITSVRKMPRPVLVDGPMGAIAASIAIFMFVLLIGAWAVWARNSHTPNKPVSDLASNRPAPAPAVTAQVPDQNAQNNVITYRPQPPAIDPNSLVQNGNAVRQPNPNLNMSSQMVEGTGNPRSRVDGASDVPPARVNVPASQPMETIARPFTRPQDPVGTVHLPDNSDGTPAGQQPNANQNAAQSPARNQGKIEIIVTDTKNGTVTSANNTSNSTPDSRGRKAVAQQYQIQGNYRAAAKEYIRALDGAGDDAAQIHQQIGQCYQRLDERESAIAHFNDAISEFKKQIASGKNVDAANRGIKYCELGIKACQ